MYRSILRIVSIYDFIRTFFGYVFTARIHKTRSKCVGEKALRSFFPRNFIKYFNNFEHTYFQPYCVRICFFSIYTQNKKQICRTKNFKKFFSWKFFGHPQFQPYRLRIRFFGLYIQNKKHICGAKVFKKFFTTQFQ